MRTALKIVLFLPLYLIENFVRGLEIYRNAGVRALNRLFGRSVEVVDASHKKVYSEPILKADKPVSTSPVLEEPTKMETAKEPSPAPKEVAASLVEEPSIPVIETPASTTTTLIEKEPDEDKGGWEWDANNPDQIRVRYPEPVVPSNKSSYLTTALGVIGLAAITLPAIYYGSAYLPSFGGNPPTHAWRMVTDHNPNGAFICVETPCDGTFDCVDNCPEDLIPKS